MLIRTVFVSALFILACGSLPAQDREKIDPTLAEKIQNLIRDLGDDDYSIRENASEELRKVGPPALAALEKAAQDKDLERAHRAKEILESIKSAQKPQEAREPAVPSRGALSSRGRKSIQIQNGRVRVSVWNPDTRAEEFYEAESMEEFKKKYPELSKQLGIDVKIERAKPGRENPVPEDDPVERWMKDFEQWRQEMDRMFDDDFFSEDFRKSDRLDLESLLKRLDRNRGTGTPQELLPSAVLEAKLSPVDESVRKKLGLGEGAGAVVTDVDRGGSAEHCGLKAGDVIVSINAAPVEGSVDVRQKFAQAVSGRSIEIVVIRDGARKTLTVDPSRLRKK